MARYTVRVIRTRKDYALIDVDAESPIYAKRLASLVASKLPSDDFCDGDEPKFKSDDCHPSKESK